MKPWEKYSPEGSGPWAKYASAPEPEQPSMLRRAGTAIKDAVVGKAEDYPEVPIGGTYNPQDARTPEGQLNILRKMFPNAKLAEPDKYGNQLVTLGQPVGGLFDYPEDQKYYINRPGLSFADRDYLASVAKRSVLPAATSAVAGPLGPVVALPMVGGAGTVAEGMGQIEANMQGAGEKLDANEMAKVGALTMLGEGTGRILSPVLGAVGRAWQRVTGKAVNPAQIMNADGSLTDDALAQLQRMGVSPDELSDQVVREMNRKVAEGFTPDQALRAADFEAVGIKPTTGQITRDFGQQQFEIEQLAKSGNPHLQRPMAERMVAQNRALLSSADELQGMVGGTPDELIAGVSTKTALRGKERELQRTASELYKRAREAKGVDAKVPTKDFLAKTKEVLDDFEDVIPPPIKARLDEFSEGARKLTVGEAEKFRQLINSRIDTPDRAAATGMRKIKDALDEAVDSLAEGKDEAAKLFAAGREASRAKHAEFSQKDIVEAIVNKKAQFTDTIPDEQVVKKVVLAGSIDDLNKVKLSLNTGTEAQREAGKEAWDNIRAATTKKLMDSALSGSARNEAGEVIFNANALQKELDKIGLKKLRMIYTQPEIEKLYAIKRAGQALIPLRSAVNYSNTSSALKARFNSAIKALPGGDNFVDFWLRGARNRALEGKPVTEAMRRQQMAKRITPKVGAAAPQLDRDQ